MIVRVTAWLALGAVLASGSTVPDSSRLWMVPVRTAAPALPQRNVLSGFAKGAALVADARYAEALPLVGAPGLAATPLGDYGLYLTGVVHQRLNDTAKAREAFARLRARRPAGFLAEAALLSEADAAAALNEHAAAARLYGEAIEQKLAAPEDVLLRLARSARAAGDTGRAVEAFAKVYAEFPTSDQAAAAQAELEKMPEWPAMAAGSNRYRLELARAERLYAARRYQPAFAAFDAIRPFASGDDAELVALRLAECEFSLRRFAAARVRLRPLADRGARAAEARFYYLSATRDLGDRDEYERLARDLVETHGTSPWAEEALNGLASFYIIKEEDERADETFRELLARFPGGRHAERAVWKVGWWAYKHGQYAETARRFESAAGAFPRSDYRPAYLYWTARAYQKLDDPAGAEAAALATMTAYRNSYYGRLAEKLLGTHAPRAGAALPPAIAAAVEAARPPATHELITLLLSLDLYDQAIDELLYVQRTSGTSPLVDATLGWAYNRKGDYRRGIIAMRRAYPQFLAAGGELLPGEMRQVIFPVDYWPLIVKHASARHLDPYLVSALIAQESAYDPAIRSTANAIGLMQILPSTGRRYARKLGIRRYSTAMLTRPEINIQIGTAYFSDLVTRFGRVEFALCGYNAGESRIAQWMAERPGLERDEFIDDVPFPETQNYLKRILGPVEDYRQLYGAGGPPPRPVPPRAPPKAPVKKAPAQ